MNVSGCKHTKAHSTKGLFYVLYSRCKTVETPTAQTLFHKVKFGVRKAFLIAFELTASTKGMSDSQLAKRYGIRSSLPHGFLQRN